jgi:hypothetical protein
MEGIRGGAAYLRVGGTPTQRALFGGEVITWFRNGATRTNVTATALLYPFYEETGVPGHDLFFKGGFGVAATSGADTGVGMTARQQLLRHPERGFRHPALRGTDGHDDPLHTRPWFSLTASLASTVAFCGGILRRCR